MTSSHLEFIPLTTTLSAQQYTYFLVQLPVHCTSQSVYEGIRADSIENLVEVSITNIHCSPSYQASYLRTEGYHFG